MALPAQPGLFHEGSTVHLHLEFDVDPGAELPLAEALASVPDGVVVVIGLGPDLARALLPASPAVDRLMAFEAIGPAEGPVAPATQHDLWVWLQGIDPGEVLMGGRRVRTALGATAVLADEVSGFTFRTNHDLFAFEDGTENPDPGDAPGVACRPVGDPDAGGSHAFVQRWIHDLDGFDALAVPAQEAVIGRTKDGSVELEGEAQPPTSHVSRTALLDDGSTVDPIWRRSTPYGTTSEAGLLFVAFASSPEPVHQMLERMFGVSADGLADALLPFSTAVSGSNYYVPPVGAL